MRTIGPFELRQPLARGAHAVVHLARWSGDAGDGGTELVAKVALDGCELALHAENAALHAVEHRNVIAPVGFVDDGRQVALVLPRAACSLRAHEGRLADDELAPVVTELADALAELHRAGLCHGDVSAGNVLLLPDATPVLSDLGRAATVTSAAAGRDVANLARAALECRRPEGSSPLTDLLTQVVAGPCDAAALRECVEELGIAGRPIDVRAAPPLAVEPPTVVVD
jgi:tRNA A-37 threonylcarbamoyl transferase component Bud32